MNPLVGSASGPRVVLETSVAIAYLQEELESSDIVKLLEMSERGEIVIRISKYAWDEIDPDRQPASRLTRLRGAATPLPNVMRLDVSTWDGGDVLGHEASNDIERLMRSKGAPDCEQLLSYAATHEMTFFVTKDTDFAKVRLRELCAMHDLRIGTPLQCVEWLESLGNRCKLPCGALDPSLCSGCPRLYRHSERSEESRPRGITC